jgi:hypothetical protein
MGTDELEKKIEQMQIRIKQIDEQTADPAVWRDARKCDQLAAERKKLMDDLEPLEFEWMRRAEDRVN